MGTQGHTGWGTYETLHEVDARYTIECTENFHFARYAQEITKSIHGPKIGGSRGSQWIVFRADWKVVCLVVEFPSCFVSNIRVIHGSEKVTTVAPGGVVVNERNRGPRCLRQAMHHVLRRKHVIITISA